MNNYQVIEYQLFSALVCYWLIVDVTKKELTFGGSSFICEMFVMGECKLNCVMLQ